MPTPEQSAAYQARQPYRDAVRSLLISWPGREFRPGEPAQCMNFVRYILGQVGVPLATAITRNPLDGHDTAPAIASSLAGTDLGEKITDPNLLQAGDVLFFVDTYATGYPPNTITHVALSLGGNVFVHRPTSARPVERASVNGYWADHFLAAIRPTVALATLKAPSSTHTDPDPARTLWKVFKGPQDGAKLLDSVPIDINGRATMTAQVLAGLLGFDLIINNEAKALRFQPRLGDVTQPRPGDK